MKARANPLYGREEAKDINDNQIEPGPYLEVKGSIPGSINIIREYGGRYPGAFWVSRNGSGQAASRDMLRGLAPISAGEIEWAAGRMLDEARATQE